MKELKIELFYKERGYIGTKRVNESKWLLFEFLTAPDKTNAFLKEFSTAFKQALRLFASNKVYDVEIRLESDTTCYFLITQSYSDKEQGVYTVYDYGTKAATNILKSSKAAIIKRFENVTTQGLQDNNII